MVCNWDGYFYGDIICYLFDCECYGSLNINFQRRRDMKKIKKILTFLTIFALIGTAIIGLSACSGEYKFLQGTWRNQEWNSHTDVWFNEDITEFKYLFQNEYTGIVQRWEGTVEKNKNSTTNQISVKLIIDDTSSFSFIVKSDSEGTTYLEDTSGRKFYKV